MQCVFQKSKADLIKVSPRTSRLHSLSVKASTTFQSSSSIAVFLWAVQQNQVNKSKAKFSWQANYILQTSNRSVILRQLSHHSFVAARWLGNSVIQTRLIHSQPNIILPSVNLCTAANEQLLPRVLRRTPLYCLPPAEPSILPGMMAVVCYIFHVHSSLLKAAPHSLRTVIRWTADRGQAGGLTAGRSQGDSLMLGLPGLGLGQLLVCPTVGTGLRSRSRTVGQRIQRRAATVHSSAKGEWTERKAASIGRQASGRSAAVGLIEPTNRVALRIHSLLTSNAIYLTASGDNNADIVKRLPHRARMPHDARPRRHDNQPPSWHRYDEHRTVSEIEIFITAANFLVMQLR